MSDDDRPDYEAIRKGEQASRLMEDEAFCEACERVEADIVGDWKAANSVGKRERAHAKMEVLFDVVRALGAIAGDGELEKLKIDEDE